MPKIPLKSAKLTSNFGFKIQHPITRNPLLKYQKIHTKLNLQLWLIRRNLRKSSREKKILRMESHIYSWLQKFNRSGSGNYHCKPHKICITTKNQLCIHSRNAWYTPSFEYNIYNQRKWLHYIHRLEKQLKRGSKVNCDWPKSAKTQAHHSKPTENRKKNGTLLETWTRWYSRKRIRR